MPKKQTPSLPLTTQFWLTRRRRISLMITLILTFFVLAPYIVFYTIGWRYDWQTKQLLSTGVINVDVQPRTAKTYINDVLVGEQQPLRLASRAPGLYNLRIEAPGYRPWIQSVNVKSHQTTFVSNIELYRTAEPTMIFEKERDILAAYPGTQTQYLLAIQAIDSGYQIGYLHANNPIIIATTTERPHVYPSTDHTSALIITPDAAGQRFMLARLNTPETRLLGWQTSSVRWQWHPEPTRGLIVQKNGQLIQHNFSSISDSVMLNSTATIWFYDVNERLWTANGRSLLMNNNPVADVPGTITAIIDANPERVLVQHDGNITVVRLDNRGQSTDQTTRALTHVRYSPKLNEWLAWSNWELWNFYADGSVHLLMRSQESIQDVYPLDELGAILIAYPTGIEAFNPGYFVTDRLANLETVEHLEANVRERAIYAVGRYRSQPGLYKLEY